MPQTIRPDTHTGITAEHERKLRRHIVAGGVSGSASCYVTPSASVSAGLSPYAVNSGWSIIDSAGNSGISIVSGAPSYAPGVYISQVLIGITFPVDGTENDLHVLLLNEYMLGNVKVIAADNQPWDYSAVGTYYVTSQTASVMEVAYQVAPPGASGSPPTLTLTEAYLFVTRLGDVPA